MVALRLTWVDCTASWVDSKVRWVSSTARVNQAAGIALARQQFGIGRGGGSGLQMLQAFAILLQRHQSVLHVLSAVSTTAP